MKTTSEQWKVDLLEYRQKHFKLTVEPGRLDGTEILLSITHNGSQWFTTSFLPDEARTVIEALKKYMEEHQL